MNSRTEPLMKDDVYINERLKEQLDWYSNKSSENKQKFHRLKRTEIIIAGLIPVFVGILSMADDYPILETTFQLLAALGGVALVIINKFLDLGAYYELWKEYRSMAEALRTELILYQTGTNPYDDKEAAFGELVEKVETLLNTERQRWLSRQPNNKTKEDNSTITTTLLKTDENL